VTLPSILVTLTGPAFGMPVDAVRFFLAMLLNLLRKVLHKDCFAAGD
jgi:hypothetical protein